MSAYIAHYLYSIKLINFQHNKNSVLHEVMKHRLGHYCHSCNVNKYNGVDVDVDVNDNDDVDVVVDDNDFVALTVTYKISF